MDELSNWQVEPESTAEDGKPKGWRNTETGTFIGLRYDDEVGRWEVSGENSRVNTADTLQEARELAHEFMANTPRPSPMV